jgi:hypothetical protein
MILRKGSNGSAVDLEDRRGGTKTWRKRRGDWLRPTTSSRSCGQWTPETVADTFVLPRTSS